MNISTKRPYLIIPKLIEQPTWGGAYILNLKNWSDQPLVRGKKIGQSYELFSQSKILLGLTSSHDASFSPDFGFADKPDVLVEDTQLKNQRDYVFMNDFVNSDPKKVVGAKVFERFGKMPILIKINQSSGNSFQLHIKPGTKHPRWRAKPESWYYFEDGLATFGIKTGVDIAEYKKVCVAIDQEMKKISDMIKNKKLSVDEGRKNARDLIKKIDPWQFVNKQVVKKFSVVDPSAGGIHHSWEEDKFNFPLGNVLYEVQLDIMDPVSTIRAFDQGKIKDNGDIRQLNIDDYFQFLDLDPKINDINNARGIKDGNKLFLTPYYCMDIIEIQNKFSDHSAGSFCHLYVRDGEVEIISSGGTVNLLRGFSCFIPANVGDYEIKSKVAKSTILKTFIDKNN